MAFWSREVVGWSLVGLGLLFLFAAVFWVAGGRYVEAGTTSFVGFVIFRGGIHLLKVAVAAQVLREAAANAPPQSSRQPLTMK